MQWGPHQWLNVSVDENGVICPDDSDPSQEISFSNRVDCLQYLGRNPGRVLAAGTGAVVLGGGFLLAAAPLAALGAAIVATGITILKITVIGGVVTAIAAASTQDDKAIDGLLKGVGMATLTGVATIAAGGLIAIIGGLCLLLGGLAISCGLLVVSVVAGHQCYLYQSRKREMLLDTNSSGRDIPGMELSGQLDAESACILSNYLKHLNTQSADPSAIVSLHKRKKK